MLALLLLLQPPAKLFLPDAATVERIATLRADLDDRLARLPADTKSDLLADVAVYAKAAEWTVRHDEWLVKDSAAQTVRVLEAGILRAKELAAGRSPWREALGRPVVIGYRSSVDGSVQPVIVTRPSADAKNDRPWNAEIVLHGRDDTLTEVKFIARAEAAKPSGTTRTLVEPYGRGNNAYRWAGEADVTEAVQAASSLVYKPGRPISAGGLPLLRGFSMGGAGTWHLGLHQPYRYAAIQPGAGFTTTRGYVPLPDPLPDYVEKCLTIYDAQRYAENVLAVPTVAYSGEKDKQKAAADGIERALKGFADKLPFAHVVAPGLEHKQPPDWVARCDDELARLLPQKDANRFRLVTYTPRYGSMKWATICGLERLYERAVLDIRLDGETAHVSTENVRQFQFSRYVNSPPAEVKELVIDGQKPVRLGRIMKFFKENGRWRTVQDNAIGWGCAASDLPSPMKTAGHQGPIDDAFRDTFRVILPTGDGWHPGPAGQIKAEADRMAKLWDKLFRGRLHLDAPEQFEQNWPCHFVLFGDPASNPAVAKAVAVMPITWTRDVLEVNGKRYDPATHYPVLIYPSPRSKESMSRAYVVLNSGHTFGEKEFQGSNALLYPRLGDWAVKKVTGEVVAAGLFDANWQFVPSSPTR